MVGVRVRVRVRVRLPLGRACLFLLHDGLPVKAVS